ncbi:hypothetical protein [Pareuzebyella sediminis]|uniref:hypothetical protein n=1 Tax=Pareuzebyella sediminis TaxID=2607998 RepID=UPI0011F03FB3|nr:hypothetical protein [Pareuzebyella sediminis]
MNVEPGHLLHPIRMLILTFSFWALFFNNVLAKEQNIASNDSIVYVWDFSVSDPSIREIGTMLTNDFETELINSGLYTVLERRRYNRVLAHQNLENKIADIQNLPAASIDSLKANRAGVVIFGEVKDDIDSGVYEVTVTFQGLSEVILRKGSVLIGRGLIRDNQTRKEYMKELLDKVHRKELLAAKNSQYHTISKLLETYIIRVKDVSKEFKDVTKYALDHPEYTGEIVKVVNNYNTIFNDINGNGSKYLMEFGQYWPPTKSQELQIIFNNILDETHKTHILKLDKIRTAILEYQTHSGSKKEKEKKKADILKNLERNIDDLNRQVDILDLRIHTFLSYLQTEMNNELNR